MNVVVAFRNGATVSVPAADMQEAQQMLQALTDAAAAGVWLVTLSSARAPVTDIRVDEVLHAEIVRC